MSSSDGLKMIYELKSRKSDRPDDIYPESLEFSRDRFLVSGVLLFSWLYKSHFYKQDQSKQYNYT